MTSRLIVHFEDNYSDAWGGTEESLFMYKQMCFNWNIDELRIIDLRSDKSRQPRDETLNMKYYSSLEESISDLHNCVYIDIHGTTNLWAFKHKKDMNYIIGASYGYRETPIGIRIRIPQNGHGELHSTHIASIILSHRYMNIG